MQSWQGSAADEAIFAEQVKALYQRVGKGVLASNAAGWLLILILNKSGGLEWHKGLIWISIMTVFVPIHLSLWWGFRKRQGSLRFWAYSYAVLCFLEGLGWGFAPVWLVMDHDILFKAIAVAFVLGNCAGAVAAFGPWLPAYLSFVLPACLPAMLAGLMADQSVRQMAAAAIAIFAAVMAQMGRDVSRSFRTMVELKNRAESLTRELQRQYEIALDASRSKSTFLAAASHDLRQPVHALGLFMGALRGAKMEPRARQIVRQMETSIAALDGLFNALLDISRLDAGVVEANPHAFRLGPLVDRVCRDYAREAREKRLRFSHIAPNVVVRSDPVLVERVLRNLVSNAVRHTKSGRIVVGCRRSGDVARLMVLDTGPGIKQPDQERIFGEFVQLDNPERDRTKGLGLGLAIVRRLAELLGSPLRLTSRPGRGSCFELYLPVTDEPVQESRAEPLLITGSIIVVDDEASIREAMLSLLSKWGHKVAVAASGDEAIALLDEKGPRPQLLLCDYRLRGNETGLMVIERLRQALGGDLPAILISGDTAPERLAEARSAGATLLHKPLSNGALRAAINGALLSRSRTS